MDLLIIDGGMSGPAVLLEQPRTRNRGVLSCTECHRRKQKCNRRQPCSDCLLRKVPHKCYFLPVLAKQKRVRHGNLGRSTRQGGLAHAATVGTDYPTDNDVSLVDHYFCYASSSTLSVYANPGKSTALDPFMSLPQTPEWLPKHALLHHFLQRLAPWLTKVQVDNLLPRSPRTSWLPEAVHHPALLNATLLASAVHLDKLQHNNDRMLAIWLKIETLRKLNESLATPSDEAIICSLIVLYFTIDGGNFTEYEAHLRGIHQLIKLRGGIEKLGMRGQLKNWLKVCHGPWNSNWENGHFQFTCELPQSWGKGDPFEWVPQRTCPQK